MRRSRLRSLMTPCRSLPLCPETSRSRWSRLPGLTGLAKASFSIDIWIRWEDSRSVPLLNHVLRGSGCGMRPSTMMRTTLLCSSIPRAFTPQSAPLMWIWRFLRWPCFWAQVLCSTKWAPLMRSLFKIWAWSLILSNSLVRMICRLGLPISIGVSETFSTILVTSLKTRHNTWKIAWNQCLA